MDPEVQALISNGILIAGFAVTIFSFYRMRKKDDVSESVTIENHAIRLGNVEKRLDEHNQRIMNVESVQKSIEKLEAYSKDQSKDLKELKRDVTELKVELAKNKGE